MKKISVTILLLLVVETVSSQEMDAAKILKEVDKVEGYKSLYMEMEQLIITSSGAKRTLVIHAWALNNGDKQLSLYQYPADIKGQKILMTGDGDNIWMFNAETRRTRKLGSHMKKKKVMGSDFTYEDQAGGKMSEKYQGIVVGEQEEGGTLCYKLELRPKQNGPSYGKVVAWIEKTSYVTRRVDFYKKTDESPYKRLLLSDIRDVDGKKTPFRIVMKSLVDTGETVNIVQRASFNADIPLSIFDPTNLEK